MRTRVPNVLIPLTLGVLLSGCSSLPSLSSIASVSGEKVMGLVTPYRVEIVQGDAATEAAQTADQRFGPREIRDGGVLGQRHPALVHERLDRARPADGGAGQQSQTERGRQERERSHRRQG